MDLNELLVRAGVGPAENDAQVLNITDDIAGVGKNTVFVCIKGDKTDGHVFAAEAAAKGAAAVICSENTGVENAVYVENTRLAFSRLSAAFYDDPDKKLVLIGITGTNGKTTAAAYIKSILERCGHRTAVIGTLGVDYSDGPRETGYTTPPGNVFFAALDRAVKNGCEYCAAEVSSQALHQYRVHGASFRVGVLTNIGRDHLDYHKTVNGLVEAKKMLCSLSSRFLVNADDAYAQDFLDACGDKAVLYSCKGKMSDFSARDMVFGKDNVTYELCGAGSSGTVTTPVPGEFSVYNSLAAAAACVAAGIPFESAVKAASHLPKIPGRMQFIYKNGVRICVDFAHTPSALSAALSALKNSGGRLITVFGCGGDRDSTKRPVMGNIASAGSDAAIITSDNPRFENPGKIIEDILSGVNPGAEVFVEPDREKAIRLALNKALPGDTVLIAGKGHEKYQLVGGEKIPFSDVEAVKRL